MHGNIWYATVLILGLSAKNGHVLLGPRGQTLIAILDSIPEFPFDVLSGIDALDVVYAPTCSTNQLFPVTKGHTRRVIPIPLHGFFIALEACDIMTRPMPK